MEGGGAWSTIEYYGITYPDWFKVDEVKDVKHHITLLEAKNMVVAVKSLGPEDPRGYEYILVGDNMSAVASLSAGRAVDPVLATCAREIWLHAALNDIRITVIHAPGESMVLADALSRKALGVGHRVAAERLVREKNLKEIVPDLADAFTPGL